jgi:hypothetical protein
MKLHIKKILTDFCDTRTHFTALARACFHESHVCDKSLMWVCCACAEERLAHRYARTRRAIPRIALLLKKKKDIASPPSRDRVITLLVTLPLRGFSPPVPGSILVVLWGSVEGRFFVNFLPLINFFRHQHHHQHVVSTISSSKFVVSTS